MPSGPHRAETYATLSELLWLDHQALVHVLDGLRAGDPVPDALAELRLREVLRAAEVEPVVGAAVTLRELAAAAPQPWQFLLAEHRTALLCLLAEIDVAAAAGNTTGTDVRQESLLAFLR